MEFLSIERALRYNFSCYKNNIKNLADNDITGLPFIFNIPIIYIKNRFFWHQINDFTTNKSYIKLIYSFQRIFQNFKERTKEIPIDIYLEVLKSDDYFVEGYRFWFIPINKNFNLTKCFIELIQQNKDIYMNMNKNFLRKESNNNVPKDWKESLEILNIKDFINIITTYIGDSQWYNDINYEDEDFLDLENKINPYDIFSLRSIDVGFENKKGEQFDITNYFEEGYINYNSWKGFINNKLTYKLSFSAFVPNIFPCICLPEYLVELWNSLILRKQKEIEPNIEENSNKLEHFILSTHNITLLSTLINEYIKIVDNNY